MRAFRWTMLGMAAVALAGCGSKTETHTSDSLTAAGNSDASVGAVSNSSVTVPGSAGKSFADMAAAGDAFEIASSRLAQQQASSTAIKKFADGMIKAHTESSAKLKSAAAAANPAITPNPALTAAQQQKLDALKSLNGAAFDTAYASAQVEAHQQTLDALKANSSNQEVPEALRNFSAKLIPTVTAHLNMAKSLSK
ncbi:putative membrane protein [Sphingomonas sp. NFR04]|uniref:DUF4142 domain-containing protein n=1 Tax=Sphingomonas sp. NFR04 TaxID=1566283 RepID=UPI0008ED7B8A|nr:DUF4142 domain-containing protein [Sphingomonas sp. NFR04]SFK53292.1 putative membrane protein [Sphingomonas sp. NFR04]